MTYVLSWVGIKDGQGTTTSALAVAHELARRYHVLLLDADQSGTGTLADLLDVDAGQRGMSRFAGALPAITASMLREESVPVPRHGNLFLLPGLDGVCGKPAHVLAGELERGQALAQIPFHFVVIDWGSAWSHAGLDSPARSAEAICRLSDRVFVQVVGSPVLLTRAIRVLQQARPPRAELVLLETRRTELRRELQRTLTTHLPHLELAATGRWDHRAAVEAEDRGTTMTGHGQHLVTTLQLSERAMPVLRARPPAPSPAVQEG